MENSYSNSPTPVTLDELEGLFGSLASATVTGKDTLYELVKSNAALTKTFATLTDANSCLTNNVEALTNEFKGKKNSGGGGVPELRNEKERKYCSNCKRPTWHVPDDCFELDKNKDNRPSWSKYVLWRRGTEGIACNVNKTSTDNTYSLAPLATKLLENGGRS